MNESNDHLNSDVAVEAVHLTKRFGNLLAVDDINLTIYHGEIFGLLGPNGAGKTTFTRMLNARTFTNGAIYSIEGFPDWVKNIALVNPEIYAVHALRFLMYKGATFSAIKNDFLFLTVFTMIMVGIAIITFKRTL